MFIFLYFIISLTLSPRCSCDFSVPTEVLDVSTFNSITDIDNSTQQALNGSQSGAPGGFEAITAVTVRVFGGEDDPDAGAGLDFFGFPPPSSIEGINSSPEPQSSPCLAGEPNVNCSVFLGSNNESGPITMQFSSSLPIIKYRLIDTGIRVPYGYLDHNPSILYCMPNHGPEGDKQNCDMGAAEYISYDDKLLLNPFLQNIFTNPDPSASCRGSDNDILGNYVWYSNSKSEDFVTPGCFACSISDNSQYYDKGYTTIPHFCPFPLAHPPTVPIHADTSMKGIDGDTRTSTPITADAASLEDWFFWCYGLVIGYYSDLTTSDETYIDISKGTTTGQYVDMISEYDTAYKCTLTEEVNDNCIPYYNVAQISNDTRCYLGEDEAAADVTECSSSVLNQVTSAISFLTASCDAHQTGEDRSPATYSSEGADPYGFTCPGDQWPHVRPNVAQPTEGLNFARCSAGCSDKSTVTHTDVPIRENQQSPKHYAVQSVMKEKGTVELGPTSCKVYRIQNSPRAQMDVSVLISAPDGQSVTQQLSTTGFSFATSSLEGANFSTRIVRIDTTGGISQTLDGFIVICGTDDPVSSSNGQGGRDVSQCAGLDDPAYNITDQDECSVSQGFLRGVFPEAGPDGTTLPGNPNKNPWPDLIRAMRSDFESSCNANAQPNGKNDCLHDQSTYKTVSEYADAQERSCAVPTPKYLSKLNCGRRVSWYYVDPINVPNYGSGCGQLGFRNAHAATPGGAQFMCQQGDFTCTPGFGTPRYGTSAASTQAQSPCQEQGTLTNFQLDTLFDVGSEGCASQDVERPLNLPPGWAYGQAADFTPGGFDPTNGDGEDPLLVGVPNMWVDGLYLYKQPSSSESAGITLEVEVYTNTFFGGEYMSFTGGTINQTDPEYCAATVGIADSGSTAVLFCNSNQDFGGTYSAKTECGIPETILLETPPNQQVTISVDNEVVTFVMGPGDCSFQSWTFSVQGPVEITQVYCTTTLFSGGDGGIGTPLAQEEYSCNVQIPTFVSTGERDVVQTTDFAQCHKWDLLCQLSTASGFEQAIIYTYLIIFYIIGVVYVISVIAYIKNKRKADKLIADLAAHTQEKQELNQSEQARKIAAAINAKQPNNQ